MKWRLLVSPSPLSVSSHVLIFNQILTFRNPKLIIDFPPIWV